jgi:hypothetical protein
MNRRTLMRSALFGFTSPVAGVLGPAFRDPLSWEAVKRKLTGAS